MAPQIALFPACGGLASGILKQLLRQVPASELLLVARKPEKLEHLRREGATVRYADYDVPASLGGVFEGASVLMLVSYASIEIEYRANAHKQAIDSAVHSGVRSIFYSSLAFGGDLKDSSVTQVMGAHLETERYLASRQSDNALTYTVIREGIYSESFPIYTAWLDPANPPSSNLITIPHDGTGPGVAWAKREELGEATANMLISYVKNPEGFPYVNQKVLLSGPREISFGDSVDIIGREIGKPLKIRTINVDEYTRLPAVQGTFIFHDIDLAEKWATAWEGMRQGEMAATSDVLEKWLGREPEAFETTIHNLIRGR